MESPISQSKQSHAITDQASASVDTLLRAAAEPLRASESTTTPAELLGGGSLGASDSKNKAADAIARSVALNAFTLVQDTGEAKTADGPAIGHAPKDGTATGTVEPTRTDGHPTPGVIESAKPEGPTAAEPTNSIEWLQYNVADPFVNGALLEPYNAVANTINSGLDKIGSNSRLGYTDYAPVAQAETFSGAWLAQGISGGLGSLIPYVLAGKGVSGAARSFGAARNVTGIAATLAKSESAAQIAGAGLYDYARLTREGETSMGNALGGASSFAVFEAGNMLSRGLPGGALTKSVLSVGLRSLTGVAGATTHQTVSGLVARGELPTSHQLYEASAHGAVMNVALPATQRLIGQAVTRPVDYINTRLGRGIPVDRYVQNHYGHETSVTLNTLVGRNPWTRVVDNATTDSASIPSNRIYLKGDAPKAGKVGHELKHLTIARDPGYESGFQRAADMLGRNMQAEAWSAYKEVRASQETMAIHSELLVHLEANGTPQTASGNAFAWKVAEASFKKVAHEYEPVWQKEFEQFKQSGGNFRPDTDYSGVNAWKLKPDEVGTPAELKDKTVSAQEKAAKQKEADIQREIATELARTIQNHGEDANNVGGSVRAQLLNEIPKDFDLATSAPPEKVIKILRDAGYADVNLVGKAFGVVNVRVQGRQFEIATYRVEEGYSDKRHPDKVTFVRNVEADANRRDMTMNAIYYNPVTGKFIDPVGGIADIKAGIIRAVGDPYKRIDEDPLRMMRFPRFASRYEGMRIDPKTYDALVRYSSDITHIAPERIASELKGILTSSHPVVGLQIMMGTGLMQHTLPEVYRLRGPKGRQDPTWHPEKTTWTHTKMVVNSLTGSSFERMMGGLLHDVGKPDTQVILPGGKITNHGHDAVGADVARGIANRLKLSNDQTHSITEMVRLHMQMHSVQDLRQSRLLALLERPDIMDLIALQHADATGTFRADRLSKSQEQFLLQKLEELRAQIKTPAVVTGRTLLDLDFTPGPAFSRILKEAKDAQREGEFSTEEGGKRWVLERYAEQQK